MFYILSSSFSSKSKYVNVHQNYPVTHCIFISPLYIWYEMKHGVPCFTSANTRRSVSFIESPKSFFFHIYCPTDAKMFRYGMERSFLFFYLPKWLLNLKEIHRKFCEVPCARYDFWIAIFFWQQENHTHDECRKRMSLETDRFDAKSFRYELKLFNCPKIPFISSIVWASTEKNISGECSSFFKLRTWYYLHLDRLNLYRNDR